MWRTHSGHIHHNGSSECGNVLGQFYYIRIVADVSVELKLLARNGSRRSDRLEALRHSKLNSDCWLVCWSCSRLRNGRVFLERTTLILYWRNCDDGGDLPPGQSDLSEGVDGSR